MKLLVTGGRAFRDFRTLTADLDSLHKDTPIALLIHGGAPGADSLAGLWAEVHNVPTAVYRAQWNLHGKAAGPIRNQQMLDVARPEAYLDFPGGRGTADMVHRLQEAGIPRALPPKNSPQFLTP